jgi:hypothetical protein
MRMASDLLYHPFRLIQSALDQKVEAEPVDNHRACSQGVLVRARREVACFPSEMGLPMGWSRERASVLQAKFDRSALPKAGRTAADAVSGLSVAPVRPAITSRIWFVRFTDEVLRRSGPQGRITRGYKLDTKGLSQAPVAGTSSHRPRLQGGQQRQSRGPHLPGACSERQNLRVPHGPLRVMGSVSPVVSATKWLGGTSSRQPAGLLSNSPQYPETVRAAVRPR